MHVVDVAILGAGASGLMCARTAAARGLSVTLIDRAATPGGKIPVSGGGKANFTNLHMGSAWFSGEHPEFCEYALERCTPHHIITLVQDYGIAWEERTHGQLFCRISAKELARRLAEDCAQAHCILLAGRTIRRVWQEGKIFAVETDSELIHSRRCVLALGSPAWPQAGGTDSGWRLARALGHRITAIRPVLTPLLMPDNWPLRALAGISLPVRIHLRGQYIEDDLLFTHRGISGPASLKTSLLWGRGETLYVDFLPTIQLETLLDAPKSGKLLTRTLLSHHLPQRLVDALLPVDLSRRKTAELSRAQRSLLQAAVHAFPLMPHATAGLKKAEACAGGVDTRELNPWSMESRHLPGLHIIGEMVDITGQLGGYNLHWAWASGVVAGESC